MIIGIINNTTKNLSIYPNSDLSGTALGVRIQMKDNAPVTQETSISVKVSYKGVVGWVKLETGVSLVKSITPPPPVVPPTGTTPPTPTPEQNFTVTVNTYMSIYTVLIEGDEAIQRINVVLNGRPLV